VSNGPDDDERRSSDPGERLSKDPAANSAKGWTLVAMILCSGIAAAMAAAGGIVAALTIGQKEEGR
jgi:hypothetical protein